ncbi:MAG: septum formation initiator family protein [Calditrichaeota bacterium]|nr:septum formation initiator family protein [Calditrichota bacterium]
MSLKPIKTKTSPKRKTYTVTVYYKYLPLWILLLAFTLVIFAFFTGNKSIFDLYSLYRERNELVMQKQQLEAENQRLQQEIERLQKDIDHIEKVAREKYNLKRDDETIYKVVPEEKP